MIFKRKWIVAAAPLLLTPARLFADNFIYIKCLEETKYAEGRGNNKTEAYVDGVSKGWSVGGCGGYACNFFDNEISKSRQKLSEISHFYKIDIIESKIYTFNKEIGKYDTNICGVGNFKGWKCSVNEDYISIKMNLDQEHKDYGYWSFEEGEQTINRKTGILKSLFWRGTHTKADGWRLGGIKSEGVCDKSDDMEVKSNKF